MNHPITPPPELIGQWLEEFFGPETMPWMAPGEVSLHIATQAARWGADQELDACCEWMRGSLTPFMPDQAADQLRAARRPKPPSFAEAALEALEVEDDSMPLRSLKRAQRFALIRAALERLKELEQSND